MQRNPLAANFVIAKPIDSKKNATADAAIRSLEKRGALIATRKRDGHKVIVEMCSHGRVRIYRSGMGSIDARLDYIREEVRSLGLPEGTLLIGELVVERTEAGRTFDDVGAITAVLGRSLPSAKALLAKGLVPVLYVFNALHRDSHDVTWESRPYGISLRWLHSILHAGSYVRSVEELRGSWDALCARVVAEGWEGLVLYDPSYMLAWRQQMPEPRPAGCYKWKPVNEDDFFVRADGFRFHANGQLKDVALLQWASEEKRQIVVCGRLGAFDRRTRALLSGMIDPRVLQVQFTRRYPKSGKLREPVFIRFREDKDPGGCIAGMIWPEAQYL